MEKLIMPGLLEPRTSPWASNNVLVREKDGTMSVTADFRALNNATVTESFPMEFMRQVLDWLGNKIILSTLDLNEAFYQVELEDKSKPPTAIHAVVGLL